MPRVIHFEIGADDPNRAVQFYQKVFGWDIQKWNGPEDYWLVMTGPKEQPGIDGAIMKRVGTLACVNTIDVPSVDEFAAKVTSHGGKIINPKMAIPGVGYFVNCQDSEGNVFGIIQNDPSAK